MKFKKIVGFGDSWIWGDELLDPALIDHEHAHPVLVENIPYREGNCFLGLLGKHYGVPVENFGIAGGSMQSSIWTYLWWLEHEQLDPSECLIVVGHTDANRTTFYNPNHVSYGNDPEWNRFVHSAWIHSGNSANGQAWQDMVKRHMVLTDCPEVHRLNYLQAAHFFDGQNAKYGANVLQFCTIDVPVRIALPSLASNDNLCLRNLIDHKPEMLAPMGHPNELGHAYLRDRLITEVDRVILA